MKIHFKLRDGFPILSFDLNDNKVENLEIYNKVLAQGALEDPSCTVTPGSLRALLRYYMGGDGTLDDYLNHIKTYAFFSPYQPALEIEIEESP